VNQNRLSRPPKTIGILGGMGPQAGFDLATKVTSQTAVARDQDHIPIVLYSQPDIPDRTAYLADAEAPNPAPAIARAFMHLEDCGAEVAGLACNTAHTPLIFDDVTDILQSRGSHLNILHLIEETVSGIKRAYPEVERVGVLGTVGTLSSRLYDQRLEAAGFAAIQPDHTDGLTESIYNDVYGVKVCSSPASTEARDHVLEAIEQVRTKGAQMVILGCTELPLAVPEKDIGGLALIDPAVMLARALVNHAAPDRLRPMNVSPQY